MTKKQDNKIICNLRGKENRKCRICGCKNGLIRRYGLNICRRCFREAGYKLGFKKY